MQGKISNSGSTFKSSVDEIYNILDDWLKSLGACPFEMEDSSSRKEVFGSCASLVGKGFIDKNLYEEVMVRNVWIPERSSLESLLVIFRQLKEKPEKFAIGLQLGEEAKIVGLLNVTAQAIIVEKWETILPLDKKEEVLRDIKEKGLFEYFKENINSDSKKDICFWGDQFLKLLDCCNELKERGVIGSCSFKQKYHQSKKNQSSHSLSSKL